GPFRPVRELGRGGMGVVYRARDRRDGKLVALKVLSKLSNSRVARFRREAQLLATLNHPNIAGVYGLEQEGDTSYLAMEMVEGIELGAKIAGQGLPLDEALEIARQMIAALEEAHDKGIVHRDLKPANIKIAPDGQVKVLDFGLAKALAGEGSGAASSSDLSLSPTVTAAMGTQAGIIMGTASYMSPEQARGKSVDGRTDIWAFGTVLFEMLSGQRTFRGDTATDIIAAVLTQEPDWQQLPPETPAGVRRLLHRCLQKDPRLRLRHIADARFDLSHEPAGPQHLVRPAAASGSPLQVCQSHGDLPGRQACGVRGAGAGRRRLQPTLGSRFGFRTGPCVERYEGRLPAVLVA
ncbi:MAG: serine/threonine-protein kinase, partial [Acidobacteriota bacterium]